MPSPTRHRRRARRPLSPRALTAAASLLLLGGGAGSAARAADTAFRIAVDLTGIPAGVLRTPSYAEVQFNPGGSPLAASVALSNFVGAGGAVLGSSIEREGGATGSFASGSVANSGAFNRLNQDVAVTALSTFSFDVAFSGPALAGGATDGSTFVFKLFQDRVNQTPYANGDPDGQSLVTIELGGDGTLAQTNYSVSGGPQVTVTALSPAVVPEAGTLPLVGAAFPALIGLARARRRRVPAPA